MDADAIVRFIWNDEATRPSRDAFVKMYDYMQAHPDPLPEGVVRKSPRMETVPESTAAEELERLRAAYEPGMHPNQILARARMAHGRSWPEQLTSNVMFYEGLRITREQFEQG